MNPTFKVILFLSFIGVIGGCAATNVQTVKRGNVSASLDKAIQDAKDALNTYGFDIQSVTGSSHDSNLTGERVSGQKAWVEIDHLADSSSALKVKVNKQGGPDQVGADVIFDDIQARSEKNN